MKSMAGIYHRQVAYRKTPAGKRMAEKETANIVRRQYAIMLKTLHDDFGFGAERLKKFIHCCNKFANEASKDELWFDVVSDWFEKYTGINMFQNDWMEKK